MALTVSFVKWYAHNSIIQMYATYLDISWSCLLLKLTKRGLRLYMIWWKLAVLTLNIARIENAVQVITSAHSRNGSWLGHDLMPMSKGLYVIGHILTWVWPPPLQKMFKNCNIGTARHPLSRPHRRLECSKEEIFYEKIVSTDSFAEF